MKESEKSGSYFWYSGLELVYTTKQKECEGNIMIYLAVVESDEKTLMHVINQCKQSFKNNFIHINTYDTYLDLMEDQDYLPKLDLLISNLQEKAEIRLVEHMKNQVQNLNVILYSNNLENALYAYEVNPIYFIVQNQLKTVLPKALVRAQQKIDETSIEKIAIHWNSKISVVAIKDIVMIERLNRRLRIITKDSEYNCYSSFNEFIEILKKFSFIRTHESYLVQPDFIEEYDIDHIVLKNGEYIPISRKYKKDVKNILINNIENVHHAIPTI